MSFKDRSEMEAALVQMREVLPRMWWAMYLGSLTVGFNEKQAFALVQAHVMGSAAGCVKPNDPTGDQQPPLPE